jgi:hypothetical protein
MTTQLRSNEGFVTSVERDNISYLSTADYFGTAVTLPLSQYESTPNSGRGMMQQAQSIRSMSIGSMPELESVTSRERATGILEVPTPTTMAFRMEEIPTPMSMAFRMGEFPGTPDMFSPRIGTPTYTVKKGKNKGAKRKISGHAKTQWMMGPRSDAKKYRKQNNIASPLRRMAYRGYMPRNRIQPSQTIQSATPLMGLSDF